MARWGKLKKDKYRGKEGASLRSRTTLRSWRRTSTSAPKIKDECKGKWEGNLNIKDKNKGEGNLQVERKDEHKGNHLPPKSNMTGIVFCMLYTIV